MADANFSQAKTSILSMPLILLFLILLFTTPSKGQTNSTSSKQKNTILIVILARNKAHTLPYFLSQLQKLDYPKERIALWIRSDHNIDNTLEVLKTWIDSISSMYHSINYKYENSPPKNHADENGPLHWPEMRFRHMIKLKEEAMTAARKMWADYVWFVDCDVFFTNDQILNLLIAQEKTLVAPMLESLGAYSNYWCGMKADYYYQRTEEYMPILERKKVGCFEVPMIHSCILLDLREEESLGLTFDPTKQENYNGPVDDIISFAISSKLSGVRMYVSNVEPFGFIMFPQEADKQLEDDFEQLISVKTEITVESAPLQVVHSLSKFVKEVPKDKLGFDEVYMINLLRRPERRLKMMSSFNELGIQVRTLDAVDGR